MKKTILLAVILAAGFSVYAQQKEKKNHAPLPPEKMKELPPVPPAPPTAPLPPVPAKLPEMNVVPPAPPQPSQPPAPPHPEELNEVPPPPAPLPPANIDPPVTEEYEAFLKRNKNVKDLSWSDEGRTINVYLKTGEKETYRLDLNSEKEELEKKYGKIPIAPPPPPRPPVKL